MQSQPEKLIKEVESKFPQFIKIIKNTFVEDKGRGLPDWPNWCYCPFAAAMAISSQVNGMSLSCISDAQKISALVAWDQSRKIYKFNDSLEIKHYKAVNAPKTSDFANLKDFCIYIELNQSFNDLFDVESVYCYLEQDMNDLNQQELRFLLKSKNDKYTAIPVHLNKKTLREGIGSLLETSQKNCDSEWLRRKMPVSSSDFIDGTTYISSMIILLILTILDDSVPKKEQPKTISDKATTIIVG